MKFAFLNLGCPDWSPEKMAVEARIMGYDGVELRSADDNPYAYPDMPYSARQALRETFRKEGIEICAIASYNDFGTDNIEKLDKNHANLIADTVLARDLGAGVVRSFLGVPEGNLTADDMLRAAAPYLNDCADFAKSLGVKLCFETHDAWCGGKLIKKAFSYITSPGAYILWDIENNTEMGEKAEDFFNEVGNKVAHVHIRDSRRNPETGKWRACLSGEGEVELETCLRLLEKADFDGYVSFEWEKRWIPDLEGPEIVFPHFINYARTLLSK